MRSALAVRSSSQEPITLPRRHSSAISRQVERVLEVLGMRERRRLGVVAAARGVPASAWRRMFEALGVGRHQPVLDPVVHHLDEVPGAVRAAVQEAALAAARRAVAAGCARRRVRRGASVSKIGSSRRTISVSPPIIRQ